MDHISTRSSSYNSAKFFCICFFFSLTLFIIVTAILVSTFVTKLRKPTFYLQTIQMDRSFSLRLAVSNRGNGGNETCSVVSLLFAAQNPNKIGIRYSGAVLDVTYANESVGAMDVPVFYQPPESKNVTVLMHALFRQSNVSRLVVKDLSSQNKYMEIRITGSMDARTHLMNFPLPKVQFSIDCRIGTNYTEIVLREGIKFVSTRKALLIPTLPHLSQKCSIKIDMSLRRNRTGGEGLGCY